MVRKSILEILKKKGQATVGEMADLLNMAPVSVRYHLDILQGDNLIEIGKVQREGQVGRPKQVYMLTVDADQHFPDNFAQLTAGLVDQLKRMLPSGEVEHAFHAIARDMASGLVDESGADLSDRHLDLVVDFLNARGYLAKWERTEENGEKGFLLHTHNCPYAGLATMHSELCCMDLALISELMGAECECIESIANAGTSCTYLIGCQKGSAEAVEREQTEQTTTRSRISLSSIGEMA